MEKSAWELIKEQFAALLEVIPALFKALVIFFIGYLIASIIARGIRAALKKIGADNLAQRLNQVEFVQRSGFELKPSKLFSTSIKYAISSGEPVKTRSTVSLA